MELSLPLRPPALAVPRVPRLSARALVCVALALPPLGGAWLWLRDSSLVAIRHVRIAGVHAGPEAIAIRAALDRAAEGMTTLHFDGAALRAAVADYPVVASVSARASFPHGLSIDVSERPPVADLVGPGERTAVAADGTVLGPALAGSWLPSIAVEDAPAPRTSVHEALVLAAATVLGAAPPQLLRDVARAYEGSDGLTLQMRNGLLVYFGDATLPHAKWLSLARVLSSPTSAGAVYVDVSLPSRPAAGFTLGAVASHAAASAATANQLGSADPAAATLAERLTQATGVGASTGTTSSTASAGESEEPSGGAGAGSEGEHGAAGGASTATSAGGEASGTTPSGASAGASTNASAGATEQASSGVAGGTQAP